MADDSKGVEARVTDFLLDQSFLLIAATVFVAGIARGLSGFGTGLITAPVAATIYDPITAVVLITIIDSLPILPVTTLF